MPTYLPGFMVGWALQSILWAGLLYQFGVPGAFSELQENWKRLIIACLIPAILLSLFGVRTAGLVSTVGLVVLEFYYRGGRWGLLAGTLLPWLYLAAGIQIAFIYNSAIVSVRRFDLYDPFFLRLDAMAGISVPRISHAAAAFYAPAEAIYYAIGGVMGAALLFLCLDGDRRAAFQMAGAIVTAYYISLLIFFVWPSHGPYALVATAFPPGMTTDAVQKASYFNASVLYHHRGWMPPALGYFVAFPSMHVVQPFIAGWFLRRWRRVSLIVFGYCGLLVPAIVILQWHYFVDIIAGLMIAALAILLVCGAESAWRSPVQWLRPSDVSA
jgi:hypothetical protein